MTNSPRTSPECLIIWSLGRSATGSRRRPHLQLLNICFSSKKQYQLCKTKTIASKKTLFLVKSSIFLLVPWRSRTLRPLGDLQGTSAGRCFLAGYLVTVQIKVRTQIRTRSYKVQGRLGEHQYIWSKVVFFLKKKKTSVIY